MQREILASPCSTEALAEVRELASVHAGGSEGRLQLLPGGLAEQAAFYVPGNPIDISAMKNIALGVEPQFTELLDNLNDGRQGEMVDETADSLGQRENVAVNMNHASLADVGVAFTLLDSALHERGCKFTPAIIGSLTLSHLGYKFDKSQEESAPVLSVLGWLADDIFLSIPPTSRMKDSPLSAYKDEVAKHNKLMKARLAKLLEAGGVLWIVLGSGTHDKQNPDQPDTMIMETVGNGTIDLFLERQQYSTRLMQAAILREKQMRFSLVDGPKSLKNRDQFHRDKQKTAKTLTEQSIGKKFNYLRPN